MTYYVSSGTLNHTHSLTRPCLFVCLRTGFKIPKISLLKF